MSSQRIFLLAGEKSGDLLGAKLLDCLINDLPDYSFEGVGGVEMRARSFHSILKSEDFETIGFIDVLFSFFKIRRQFSIVKQHILQTKPQAVVLIDYPGFNLKLAQLLRKHGFKGKIIQYVCPTVWAWGKHRIQQMAERFDLLLTIYPFEHNCFKETSLSVRYVGNPIQENIANHHYDSDWTRLFGIKNSGHMIGIFPGSRKKEIELNLPYLIHAAEKIKKEDPAATFVLSCAHDKVISIIHGLLQTNILKLNQDLFLLPKGYSYELMKDCRSAIAKSGTVCLELALHECPTVVIYKLSRLNRFIAKYLLKIRLPYYCIVNILKQGEVFPELIEKGLTKQNLYRQLKRIYSDAEARNSCIAECRSLPELLRCHEASKNASKAICSLLNL